MITKKRTEEFLTLLSLHVTYIQSLANALHAGDQAVASYSTRQLYSNAADIAAHYAKINPFWEERQWQTLLYNYTGMLIQDAVALAAGILNGIWISSTGCFCQP